MKKKIIILLSVSILLISGFSVYGDIEKNALENSQAENHINESQSMISHADIAEEATVVESKQEKQAEETSKEKQIIEAEASQEKSLVDVSTLGEPEEDEGQVESVKVESAKEEPIADPIAEIEFVVEEPAAAELVTEKPISKNSIIEEEAIDPEPKAELEVPLPSIREEFSDIFINEEINVVKSPDTVEEFKAILLTMCETNTLAYTMEYEGISFEELLTAETQAEIAEAFHSVFNQYPEYMSFTNRMTYKATGGNDTVTLTLMLASDTGMDEETLIRNREAFFVESMKIVNGLKASEKIYDGQSDREKALVLFDWVVQNTEYDNEFNAESYTGYGVYANGLGVCQGYTAAYNALSKCAGLRVEGVGGLVDGVDHIWTRALFAGDDIYIDATWGDSYVNSEKVNYDYLLVDGATLAASHTW